MNHRWSSQQEAIFDHLQYTDDHGVVVARAGCAKTTTLVEGARRIRRRSILACAFNVRNRVDLRDRMPSNVDVATMNSVANRMVLAARGPQVLDRYRQSKFLAQHIKLDVEGARSDVGEIVKFAMANLQDTPEGVEAVMHRYGLVPAEPTLYDLYIQWALDTLDFSRENDGTISYDDQVYLAALDKSPPPDTYDVVLVDEGQDLNRAQRAVVMRSVKPRGRVVVVGDDRQGVYAFNGADADSIPNFIQALDVQPLPLAITYRCPRRVVALANFIVPDLEAAPGAEDGYVARRSEEEMIAQARGGDAVISRRNSTLVRLFLKMVGAGRRVKFIGRDIAREVRSLFDRVRAAAKDAPLAETLDQLDEYVEREAKEAEARGDHERAENLRGNAGAVHALANGAGSVEGVHQKMNALFNRSVEEADEATYQDILLMSVHRAKGLEYDRVWMLEGTFNVRNTEGQNLYYVAATRAKRELYLVQTTRDDGKASTSIAESWGYFD